MNTMLSALFFKVLELSLHGGLALLLVVLLRWLMGGRIASRYRCFLWLPALLAFLVPVDFLPQNPVALPAQPVVSESVENVRAYWAPEAPGIALSPQETEAGGDFSRPEPAAADLEKKNFSWISLMAMVWLAGVFGFGMAGLAGSWRFHRRVFASLKNPEEKTFRVWAEAAQHQVHLPKILCSYGVATPVLAGLFKPTVILPAAREKFYSEELLRHIFRHELAHYRRGDLYFLALEHAVLILHWFNPLLWASHRFIRVDRELGADASALDEMEEEEADSYGQSLLEVAVDGTGSESRLSAVGIFENKKQLAERLRGIASHRKAGWVAAAGISVALVVVCLFIFGRGTKTDLTPYTSLPEDQALIEASIQGDVPAVRHYLKSRPDLNRKVEWSGPETALSGAASRNQLKVMELLLVAGADPNFKPGKGWTAWDMSIRRGHREATELLLKHGARVDEKMLAAYRGDVDYYRKLLALENPVPFDIIQKGTGIAASNNQLELYRLLLRAGLKHPDRPSWNYPGEGDLLAAMARGHKEILQETLDTFPEGLSRFKGGPVRISEAARQTPGMMEWLKARGFEISAYPPGEELIDAAGRNDLFRINQLLDAGADPNYSGESGWSPVVKAANAGKMEALKLLLSRGGDPNSVKSPGWNYSALCLTSNPEIAEVLFKAGADVNAKLFKRDVPIVSYPLGQGQTEMVKWYVSKGVDLKNARDDRPTLLFNAGSAEVAEILLQQGIDPNVRDEAGQTALFWIAGYKKNPAATLKVLLDHEADPNIADKNGSTPLMLAGDGESVELLLQHGANPNAKNRQGLGVLETGSPNASSSRLKVLLQHGFKLDPKNAGNLLSQAAWSNQAEVVSFLLDHGADPNAKVEIKGSPGHFWEPLSMAAIYGHMETLRLLLDHGGNPETGMATALGNFRKNAVRLFWERGARNISESTYLLSQAATLAELEPVLKKEGPLTWKQKNTVEHPFVYACALSRQDVVDYLWPVYGGIEPIVKNGMTEAASHGAAPLVEDFLSKGVTPSPGMVSLAANNSHPYEDELAHTGDFAKTIKLLIDAGALKNATSEERGSVMYSAVFTRYPGGNEDVIRLLLEAGLSGNEKPKFAKGLTVLELIKESNAKGYCSEPERKIYELLGGAPADLKKESGS